MYFDLTTDPSGGSSGQLTAESSPPTSQSIVLMTAQFGSHNSGQYSSHQAGQYYSTFIQPVPQTSLYGGFIQPIVVNCDYDYVSSSELPTTNGKTSVNSDDNKLKVYTIYILHNKKMSFEGSL